MKTPPVPLLLCLWMSGQTFSSSSPEPQCLSAVINRQEEDGRVDRSEEDQRRTDGSGSPSQTLEFTGVKPFRTEESPGDLILEIPALPVTPGNDVTLRCRGRGMGSTRIGSVPVRGMTLSAVQPSDEGLYSCSPDLLERSFISSFSSSSPPLLLLLLLLRLHCLTMLFAHLLAFCPFFVSTGLVLSIYLHRDMGDKGTVSMEMEKTETRSQDQKLRVRTQGCQLVSTGN
ncbi:hypothetical protein INR49_022859 [Caranx melampygus]|nr:hypothetical protein INR49_022859 [Caranx melampygus]